MPVFVAVSHATLEKGSSERHASSCQEKRGYHRTKERSVGGEGGLVGVFWGSTIASETWSQILSGCPSPTDSGMSDSFIGGCLPDVNKNVSPPATILNSQQKQILQRDQAGKRVQGMGVCWVET